MEYGGCVYIMTNKTHTVLYIGVTADLYNRVIQHKNKTNADSFTAKYNCTKIVYFEFYSRIEEAIMKEKQIKKWKREWKEQLINSVNAHWEDLFYRL
jgi:putative endonuclease